MDEDVFDSDLKLNKIEGHFLVIVYQKNHT